MNDVVERALAALEHANAIQIECLDAKSDRYFVIDKSKAEPEVNWPGECLSQPVGFDEAKAICKAARTKVILTEVSAALADASPDIGKEGIGNDVR